MEQLWASLQSAPPPPPLHPSVVSQLFQHPPPDFHQLNQATPPAVPMLDVTNQEWILWIKISAGKKLAEIFFTPNFRTNFRTNFGSKLS
jgi:hypothetical protein